MVFGCNQDAELIWPHVCHVVGCGIMPTNLHKCEQLNAHPRLVTQGVKKLPEGYMHGWRLAVPAGLKLRCKILAHFHNSPTAGHPGRDNTTTLVTQRFSHVGQTVRSRMHHVPAIKNLHHQEKDTSLSHAGRCL